MNESDGHEMNQARMRALEKMVMDVMGAAFAETGYPQPEAKLKELMEKRIEELAPGCSYVVWA